MKKLLIPAIALILLCVLLLPTACRTVPQTETGMPRETTSSVETDRQTNDPTTATVENAVVETLILSLPATTQAVIENQTRTIKVSSDGEKNSVPINAVRILSPEGEELWKGSYEADGTVQFGIVTLCNDEDDPLKRGFICWSVKTVPGESITATYMTYAQKEDGKYGKLSEILSSQGIPSMQLAGLGGGKKIDISTASAYLAGESGFISFLDQLSSKLVAGTVLFDTDGNQMQWGEWITHQIVFVDPSTGKPTSLDIIGRDR